MVSQNAIPSRQHLADLCHLYLLSMEYCSWQMYLKASELLK